MPNKFQDVDLAGYPLDVVNIHYLFFLKNLDGYLLASETVSANHYFPKGPFSKISTQDVVSNYFSFFQVLFDNLLCRSCLIWVLMLVMLHLLHLLDVGILLLEIYHGELPCSLASCCWLRSTDWHF